MPVKIRLARRGRRKRPYYHIVVADARSPRDGKFIETIGSYNPMTSPATIELDQDLALDWMEKGAQPTETARAILRFKGVLYKKHLKRGVSKGAFSEEKAEEMWNAWTQAKDDKIAKRREQAKQEKKDRWVAISGKPGAMPEVASADAGAAQAFTAQNEPIAEEKPVAKEAPVASEAPAKQEAPVAEKVEEKPAAVEAAKVETPAEATPKAEAPVTETNKPEVSDEASPEKEELAKVPAGDAPVTEEVKDKARAAAEEE